MVRRLGVVDVSIVHTEEKFSLATPGVGGEWFVLSVRLPGETDWTLIGRRRTKAGLLGLVETLDPRHVGGRDFRTCPGSG